MPPRVRAGVLLALVWLVIAAPLWGWFFVHSSAKGVLASHDVVVHPTFSHHARVRMGPYLPDLRVPTSGPIGVRVQLGKTNADSMQELVQRYASIATRPDPEIERLRDQVQGLVLDAALRAGVVALVPVAVWVLLGPRRRRILLRPNREKAVAVVVAGSLVVLALVQPWRGEPPAVQPTGWIPLQEAIPEVAIPDELSGVEVQGGLVSRSTRRLVASAFDTYDKSKVFYADLVSSAPGIAPLLRRPVEGETVAVLVSDRHDNVGMDQVVRAVADLAGATVVLDAGDDTSTGSSWEAFSLDSLVAAFDDYDAKVEIAGNHDHGDFVSGYLAKRGWTHLDAKAATPFGDVRLFGADDPRSSGLGDWRDETGLSFAEVTRRVGDAVCELDASGDRVATLLVHDADLADDALARGCVDLVLAGHLHLQVGPEQVVGSNGRVGWRYTNGTTGGAAYALAVGSKLRRDAEFTFVTYRDGRPVGLQPVTVRTNGTYRVADWLPLTY